MNILQSAVKVLLSECFPTIEGLDEDLNDVELVDKIIEGLIEKNRTHKGLSICPFIKYSAEALCALGPCSLDRGNYVCCKYSDRVIWLYFILSNHRKICFVPNAKKLIDKIDFSNIEEGLTGWGVQSKEELMDCLGSCYLHYLGRDKDSFDIELERIRHLERIGVISIDDFDSLVENLFY